jgi:hypothetical protein
LLGWLADLQSVDVLLSWGEEMILRFNCTTATLGKAYEAMAAFDLSDADFASGTLRSIDLHLIC